MMCISIWRALVIMFLPYLHDASGDFEDANASSGGVHMENNNSHNGNERSQHRPNASVDWFEEELESDLKWSIAFNRMVYSGASEYQTVNFLDTKRFGKVLVIDGKLQSAEKDEFIYHESLVHPALLLHDDPKTVFIMGGGEGSTAREVLRHKHIEKVLMCDIDKDVVNLCREHIAQNSDAFNDNRLKIVYNDAKEELENSKEKFDVIVGDLCDPIESGPCNILYTKSFYEQVVKPKLKKNGIFVTQAGLAGILSHKDIFSPIYNTLKHVFNHVIAYKAQVPSYADECGWVLASEKAIKLDGEELDKRIGERISGELRYLHGQLILASTIFNKTLQKTLMNETHIITEENMRCHSGYGMHGIYHNA